MLDMNQARQDKALHTTPHSLSTDAAQQLVKTGSYLHQGERGYLCV